MTHCITNFVTVNDCANAVLAIGASPIMAEDTNEVEEIFNKEKITEERLKLISIY